MSNAEAPTHARSVYCTHGQIHVCAYAFLNKLTNFETAFHSTPDCDQVLREPGGIAKPFSCPLQAALYSTERKIKKKLSQESLFLTSLVPQTSFKNILSAMHFFLQRSTPRSSRNILQWVSKRIVTFPSLRIQDSRFNERASVRARSNPRIRQPFGEELAIIRV